VIPQWALVRKRVVPAGEVRRDYLASYGIALQALGSVGNALLNRSHDVEEWEPFLYRLGGVDWARTNPDWEGRILIGGRVARTFHHVALTADYLHERVGLPRSRFDVSA
jgi:DNA sulfur modification protein DndB